MLSIVKSMSLQGLEGFLVDVQVDVSAGMPNWEVVGLPDASVREAKERVRTAIKNSGYDFHSRRIVINLAPADTKKEGSFFDLPIAVGILMDFQNIKCQNLEDTVFIGELSLNGNVLKIGGLKEKLIGAYNEGVKKVYIPHGNLIDLEDIPKYIKDNLEIIAIEHFEDLYTNFFK